MTKKRMEGIRMALMIATAVALVAAGVAAVIAAVRLYYTGDATPFEPARVREAFRGIAPLVWSALGVVFLDVIYALAHPAERVRERGVRSAREQLSRLVARLDEEASADEVLLRERARRRVLFLVWAGVSGAPAVVALVLLFSFSRYGERYNAAVIATVAWLLPLCLFVAALTLVCSHLGDASIARESARAKELIAQGRVKSVTPAVVRENARGVRIARAVIALIALVLIVLGVFNGGLLGVLAKAVAICTECIGLG